MADKEIVPLINIKHPSGGRAVAGKPVAVTPELEEWAERLIEDGKARAHGGDPVTGTLAGGVKEDGEVVSLEDMKVPELKALAAEMEIEGAANMTKPQLIEAIQKEEAEFSGEGGED